MKNNDILQALGLNISSNQYNNPYGLNIGMDEEENDLGVNEDDENPYNENPELDQEIPEYEEPGGEPTYSINDLLKQKSSKNQSSPQEYSFEGGMEKALSKIKSIQNQLKGDSKEINAALNDEQRGIALRRGMGAAYQADAAKPWRSTGARGFINDLSGMMMQGLGGYDASKQQLQKENLEREKYNQALQMQQEAIARAIEKELSDREYNQQKLGLEREKIIADKDFKVQQQEALKDYRQQKLSSSGSDDRKYDLQQQRIDLAKERQDLREKEYGTKHVDYSDSKNNTHNFDVKDLGANVEINNVVAPKITSDARLQKITSKRDEIGKAVFKMEDVLNRYKDFKTKYDITEKNNPNLNTIRRRTKNIDEWIANLPGGDKKARQMWAEYKAISQDAGQVAKEAEKSIKGGMLTDAMDERFRKYGYIPNFDEDFEETFQKKFKSMLHHSKQLYEALDTASIYRADIDVMKLIKILDKQRQEAAEENKGTEENKNDITKDTEEQDERFEKYLAGQK